MSPLSAVRDASWFSADPAAVSSRRLGSGSPPLESSDMSVEQSIGEYLHDQRNRHRRPKTLEWHQHALGLFEHYLLTEHGCVLLSQITQEMVCGWLEFLQEQPTSRGAKRAASTVESYARSARAFCQWAVRTGRLRVTPFACLSLPVDPLACLSVFTRHSLQRNGTVCLRIATYL